MTNFEYVLPALKGIQGGRHYYLCVCPLRLLPKLFPLPSRELDPRKRSHRSINKNRVRKMADYILNNPKEYIFSAITASIDAEVIFEAVGDVDDHRKIGRLRIPMEGEISIQDGMYRRLALEMAFKEDSYFNYDSIPVIFYADMGLERFQQMFWDLNGLAMRPPSSLGVLYDHRNAIAVITQRVLERVEGMERLTDLEKENLGEKTSLKFTLSGVYRETEKLLKEHQSKGLDEQVDLAVTYWQKRVRDIHEN